MQMVKKDDKKKAIWFPLNPTPHKESPNLNIAFGSYDLLKIDYKKQTNKLQNHTDGGHSLNIHEGSVNVQIGRYGQKAQIYYLPAWMVT